MASDKVKEQNRKRAQALRDRRKEQGLTTFPVVFADVELKKLEEICKFFAYPGESYSHDEAISALVHRVHAEIPTIKKDLGICKMCGEPLPEGCARLREGGLFNGDANCFHTTQRVRIYDPTKETKQC
ncbi:TPA: hypothetical protein ACGUPM_002686 [Vibrio vulnificus]